MESVSYTHLDVYKRQFWILYLTASCWNISDLIISSFPHSLFVVMFTNFSLSYLLISLLHGSRLYSVMVKLKVTLSCPAASILLASQKTFSSSSLLESTPFIFSHNWLLIYGSWITKYAWPNWFLHNYWFLRFISTN